MIPSNAGIVLFHTVSFGGGYHDIYDLHLAALNPRHHEVFPRALLKINYLMRLRLDNWWHVKICHLSKKKKRGHDYYAKWLIGPY